MAVVSISRIQQRRGRAQSGTGLPQLASGELGWAIDTQELYIGNGAVSEGAPAVGNTRILTEIDLDKFNSSSNLFNLLSYVYKASGSISSYTISNGSGYANGSYQNVPLTWVSGGSAPLTIPTMNITVTNGSVSSTSLVFSGSGISINAVFTAPTTIIGNGTGFSVFVSGTTSTPGLSITKAVKRSIQSRLDDQVNTKDFGSVGDGVVDDTPFLQAAIDELYLNTVLASADNGVANRVFLQIPAGVYRITDTLYVPSYSTLVGDGVDKTIIKYDPVMNVNASITNGSNILYTASAKSSMVGASVVASGIPANTLVSSVTPGVSVTLDKNATSDITGSIVTITLAPTKPVIRFVNDDSSAGYYNDPITNTYINQPKHILIKDMSIETLYGGHEVLKLESVRNSHFENLKIVGNWLGVYNQNSAGVKLTSNTELVTTQNNLFKNIEVEGFSFGIYSDNDILNNKFDVAYITDARYGVCLGMNTNNISVGQLFGPKQTFIENFKFYNIKRHAIYIGSTASQNKIDNIILDNVGTNGGNTTSNVYPQIYINYQDNEVGKIISDRTDVLADPLVASVYLPEVAGHVNYDSFGVRRIALSNNANAQQIFRLPVSTDALGVPSGIIHYKLDYTYNSTGNDFLQAGTLYVSLDVTNKLIQFSEEYNYVGLEDYNQSIKLTAVMLSQFGQQTTTATPYGIGIFYRNLLDTDAGVLSYSFTRTS